MAGTKGHRNRFWSVEEKRSICLQARAPGVSVAQVARRYSMNSNLLFTWLRDPRFAPADDKAPGIAADGEVFLPVEISVPPAGPHSTSDAVEIPRSSDSSILAQRVDISLSDGRRILIEGPTSLPAVLGLVQGLMQ